MTTTTTTMVQDRETITTEAVVEALAVIRGQKRSGAGFMISHLLSAEEMLNGGCTKHTYVDKDGRQKPAHPLIKCREFFRLSQAL
jgi:hypothetical protein